MSSPLSDIIQSLFNSVLSAIRVTTLASAKQISTDQASAFANSALIDSQVNVDFTLPDYTKERYEVVVYNPSTVTDLTVKAFSKELALGGGTRYTLIDSFTVDKAQAKTGTTISGYVKFLEGLFVGTDVRIVVSNNTALGAAEGFTAYVRLREV